MFDMTHFQHHRSIEEITDILVAEADNADRDFFQIMVAYYICCAAAHMGAKFKTINGAHMPVNCYALALSPSGTRKGFAVSVLEDKIMNGFASRFLEETLPTVQECVLYAKATRKAARTGRSEDEELLKLEKLADSKGKLLFNFDSGTSPAVKQVRELITMIDIGALNLQIDEIGSNLQKSEITDLLSSFLELFDMGKLKQKLIKHSPDNKRVSSYQGTSPANMLAFGTDTLIFDGARNQKFLLDQLEAGFARRFIYACGAFRSASEGMTAKERLARIRSPKLSAEIAKWSSHFTHLADASKHNWLVDMPDNVAVMLLEYEDFCLERAKEMNRYEQLKSLEMVHRHSKAMKLAGAFAFVDEASVMDVTHLESAIKLVEESGEAFTKILDRDETFAILAQFIAEFKNEVTHVDIMKHLSFYPRTAAAQKDMINHAIAWGYKNHMVIKSEIKDRIEFFSGETLEHVNLKDIKFTFSDHVAEGYEHPEDAVAFKDFHKLTQTPGYNFCVHAFQDKHRSNANAIPGFDMLVFDIDGTCQLDFLNNVLREYMFMTYTTKRHKPNAHRYRLILPMNYRLKLEPEEYTQFYKDVASWLPFDVDSSTSDPARKWATYSKGTYAYNDGQLLDVRPFIPRTSRNDDYHQEVNKLSSLDALERYFVMNIANGNRNNMFFRYAMALKSQGMSYTEIENKLLSFNKRFKDGLDKAEFESTILKTVAKRLQNQP
jgi:hypothetical protein